MRRDDVQFALVTAETALAIVLLIGTTLVPALRATRIDAITAIRTE